MEVSKAVIDLATKQGGYVRRDQLVDIGLSQSAIDRRVKARVLTAAANGTYIVIPSDSHIDLMRGATLSLSKAVVSHQSAAHILRFPRLPPLEPTVVVPSHATHRFPGVTVRRCDDLDDSDIVKVDGLAVTSVVRTMFDLSGVLSFDEFDAVAESLLIERRTDLASFERITSRLARRGKTGSRAAKEFLRIRAGDTGLATALERRGQALLSAHRLPPPTQQFPIPWSPSQRFDAAYPTERIAIEWDSRAWHEQRSAMTADRRRDRQAVAHAWVVLRFTWEDIADRPDEVIETVSQLLKDRQGVN